MQLDAGWKQRQGQVDKGTTGKSRQGQIASKTIVHSRGEYVTSR